VRSKLRLEVTAGPDSGKSAVGEAKVLHIGSQEGNTLKLNDDGVSRIHLQIVNSVEGIQIKDLGSTNGTWLPGEIRISEAVIPAGTTVRVGHSHVCVDVLDEQVSESLSPKPGFGEMLGTSPAMRSIFALLERVATTDETILITGETGTGKELCARSIMERSRRAGGAFVVVDCGAIPHNLLESELFGHVRGAFTGALSDHEGAFERANHGTLFLDEIGELPLEFQTRLLRAVENRSVRRVGGTKEVGLDIRIIAATNRTLEEEVNRGTFRADLYYRLSVVQVRIPPLRERPDDVELLARHLLGELEVTTDDVLRPEVIDRMKRYRWPGNVRELRNYIRRLTLGEVSGPSPGAPGRLHRAEQSGAFKLDLSVPFRQAKEKAVERFERAYLSALMDRTGGNISQAAREAQTDRTYLSRLLNKYNITKG
jgi:transcriptional regulator with GAF, ATPase, and Fis domain